MYKSLSVGPRLVPQGSEHSYNTLNFPWHAQVTHDVCLWSHWSLHSHKACVTHGVCPRSHCLFDACALPYCCNCILILTLGCISHCILPRAAAGRNAVPPGKLALLAQDNGICTCASAAHGGHRSACVPCDWTVLECLLSGLKI